MTLSIDIEDPRAARMKVIGVGGAGGNAINTMIQARLEGVEFICVNTDTQVLARTQACQKVQIGSRLTKGLGTGGDPEIGRQAIEEDRDHITELLSGSDMVFVTAGMGGGTGTGASPVIASIARELGALTVAIVTKPFDFEGPKRRRIAEDGLNQLRHEVDTLILIPNQRLLQVVDKDTTLQEAFEMADQVLLQATQGISDLINIPGLVNLDFKDVRAVMAEGGDAIMGTGVATRADGGAADAARKAISSPLLEDVSIRGAAGVLVNIAGSRQLALFDVNDAVSAIQEAAGEEADVFFGAVVEESLGDEIRVTVIATGFNNRARAVPTFDKADRSEPRKVRKVHSEIPAFIRKDRTAEPVFADENKQPLVPTEDLEYPTFLRRSADSAGARFGQLP